MNWFTSASANSLGFSLRSRKASTEKDLWIKWSVVPGNAVCGGV